MKIVALILVVGIAVAFLIFQLRREPPPEVDTKRAAQLQGVFAGGATKSGVTAKPAETRGAFAADETLQLVGNSGTVAIVLEIPDPKMPGTPDMTRFFNLVADEVDAFKKRLKDKGRFTIAIELKLPRPEGANRTVWPTGEFTKFLQRTPPSATIVAFCYLPETLSEADKAALRSRPGKLVIVAGSAPETKPYIDQKLAHMAVTSKMPIPLPTGTEPETPIQWVMRVHTVLKQ